MPLSDDGYSKAFLILSAVLIPEGFDFISLNENKLQVLANTPEN